MVKTFAVLALFTLIMLSASAASAEVNIGISIGAPPPPQVVYVQPPSPGPEFMWIEGYWYPVRGRYRWHEGYWTQVPYRGARWMAPRYDGHMYFAGYWEGDDCRLEHRHKWDDRRERDYNRGHGHGKKHHHD